MNAFIKASKTLYFAAMLFCFLQSGALALLFLSNPLMVTSTIVAGLDIALISAAAVLSLFYALNVFHTGAVLSDISMLKTSPYLHGSILTLTLFVTRWMNAQFAVAVFAFLSTVYMDICMLVYNTQPSTVAATLNFACVLFVYSLARLSYRASNKLSNYVENEIHGV